MVALAATAEGGVYGGGYAGYSGFHFPMAPENGHTPTYIHMRQGGAAGAKIGQSAKNAKHGSAGGSAGGQMGQMVGMANHGVVASCPASNSKSLAADADASAGAIVFVLDWDDTLCASTEFQRSPYKGILSAPPGSDVGQPLDAESKRQWRALALWVKVLLHQMLMYAPDSVYILTNSQTGWVELSVDRLMPELKPLLPRLKIISARSEYATAAQELAMRGLGIQESDLVEWKYRAFLDIMARHQLQHAKGDRKVVGALTTTQQLLGSRRPHAFLPAQTGASPVIIAMGDSTVELQAMDKTAHALNIPVTKWVKFANQPTLNALAEQVHYICTILPSIIWHKCSLRITLNPDIFAIPKQDPFK